MITSKEVLEVLRTNPSFSEESLRSIEDLEASVEDNSQRMRDLGIDLEDIRDGLLAKLIPAFAVAVVAAGPEAAAMSMFITGIQAGFCLGRGYIEEN